MMVGWARELVSAVVSMLVIAVVIAVVGACGDDVASLGARFEPTEQDDAPADYGPPSPIEVGQQLWYTIATSLRRTTVNDENGVTVGEAQATGSMCLRVTKVKDTATEAYKDEPQTLIAAQVKVTGPAGETSLAAHDQTDAAATPAAIDGLMAALWLKRLTFPSSGHGFEAPRTQGFTTQLGPTSAATLAELPFFEARSLNDDRGHFWSGWEYDTHMDGAANLIGNLVRSFTDPRSVQKTTATPPGNCSSYSEPRACGQVHCTWAVPTGGNVAQCLPLYTARFVWREQLAVPAELAGAVLHKVEVMYNTDGILQMASEMIVPDNGGGRVPTDITSCGAKCLSAQVAHTGEWAPGDVTSPCAF